MLEIYDVSYISISFLVFIVFSELWEINPCGFWGCMRTRMDFLERK